MIARGIIVLGAVAVVFLAPASYRRQATPETARDRVERAYRANNLGVAYLEQYNFDSAADAFRQALQIDGRLAIARLNLAIALLYGGHSDTAGAEARTAATALPDRPQPYYVLGLVARADNRSEDAIAAFRKVLELDPADAATKINLAQVLSQERRYDQAIPLLREASATEPYNATAAYALATALTRSGDADGGQQALRRFQTLRDSAYAVTYAQTYLQQGRYAEAIASTGAEPELVDTATPAAVFTDASSDAFGRAASTRPSGAASSGFGSIQLFDLDGDGHPDLLTAGAEGVRLFRNANGRFSDATAATRLPAGSARAAVAGDYDNDGRPDLFLLRDDGVGLLHQRADRTFEDVTAAAGLPSRGLAARTAAWVDVDHDGDLDLVVAPPAHLFRNNGNGTFTDITSAAGLSSAAETLAIVPTDYDNRRDIDVMLVSNRERPALFRNMRDGTFLDAADAAHLPKDTGYTAVAAADINKDGFIDFFFGRSGAPGVFALSDGQQHFVTRPAPEGSAGATAAQFFDYDNDGLLDLFVITASGPRLFRNLGDRWQEETKAAKLEGLGGTQIQSLALGDIDGDGDTDIVARLADGSLRVWRNDGGNKHPSVRVSLASRVSNRSAAGAKVEMRAGSLRQMLETSSTVPAIAPADLVFGLGSRAAADVVRVLWPSGILQSEMTPASATKAPIKIEELDRKPSSCPYLFTWNGTRFEFVTDFMGGGEMGDWIGAGTWNTPDPDEYVRIRADQLRPRDGRYELRITNELEEAMFLDRVRLMAIDHPADEEIYPNEGLKEPPRPPFTLYATRGAHPPVAATDDRGHDVLALISKRDRRWPDDFEVSSIRGYAALHTLTMDLGRDATDAVLLMTGWTDYAFSNDNVAASHAGLVMQAPRIEMRDTAGQWRTAIENVGFPVGRPQTVLVDLRGRWLGPSREVRLVTNMRIYWDQILVARPGGRQPPTLTTLEPTRAELRWRGFSAEESPDGREPFVADYSRVSATAPWKALPGRYTREGDVRPLLARSDDMFVIARPGDEIALSFDAASAPKIPPGWQRTFLLYADGFSKEMNIRSATPDSLGPLPFHAMTKYPYGPNEHYPRDAAHLDYLERYNTRVVTRPVPSLDTAAFGLRRTNE